MSLLEIRNSSPFTDSGYYECRAMNVVGREPAAARVRLIVSLVASNGTAYVRNSSYFNTNKKVNGNQRSDDLSDTLKNGTSGSFSLLISTISPEVVDHNNDMLARRMLDNVNNHKKLDDGTHSNMGGKEYTNHNYNGHSSLSSSLSSLFSFTHYQSSSHQDAKSIATKSSSDTSLINMSNYATNSTDSSQSILMANVTTSNLSPNYNGNTATTTMMTSSTVVRPSTFRANAVAPNALVSSNANYNVNHNHRKPITTRLPQVNKSSTTGSTVRTASSNAVTTPSTASLTSTTASPFRGRACPHQLSKSFCLNGGTCLYYETVGELVCQ